MRQDIHYFQSWDGTSGYEYSVRNRDRVFTKKTFTKEKLVFWDNTSDFGYESRKEGRIFTKKKLVA